jgi:hypothetical protein
VTPALTVVRSATGLRPDELQPLLIELVRRRDAAATSRLLQAWVHRRGLASLEMFRRSVSPGLLSAADDAWLERCLHEPLVPLLGSAGVVAEAPRDVPPAASMASEAGPPPAALDHPLAAAASPAPPAFGDPEALGLAAEPWADALLSQGADGEPGLPAEISVDEASAPWRSAPQAAWSVGVGDEPRGLPEVEQACVAGPEAEQARAAGALLSDAPQRLRRKLVGSIGRARLLMRACFEEAISTLHPQMDPDSDQDRDLTALTPEATTPEPGSPSWSGHAPLASPAGSTDSASLLSAVHRPTAAPAAAWAPPLGRILPGGAPPDRSLQGAPAPAPEALADLRAWLPGSVEQTRRAS